MREAIATANAVPGEAKIILPPGTFRLHLGDYWYEDQSFGGDLDILDDVSIIGAGADSTVINGMGVVERAFDLPSAGVTASISDLSIRDLPYSFAPLGCGRGIRNMGTLTVVGVVLNNNQMRGDGGAICNDNEGTLTVIDSTITNNCACFDGYGGGIYNRGAATIQGTTVAGNWSDQRDGAGVASGTPFAPDSALMIRDSVIANNFARAPAGTRHGAGLSVTGAALIVNVTISGNRADYDDRGGPLDGRGAGLFISGDAELSNVTIFGNDSPTTAGGMFTDGSGSVILTNTIIAGNTGGDCEGPITSAGHNISGDDTCMVVGPGDMTGIDPLLAPLADNGGPTQTRGLLPGSPAIDAGDDNACPSTDQRGAPRPADGDGTGGAVCDIGAYEAGGAVPTPPPPTPTATPPPPVLAGDTDCNDAVNAVDALWALRFSAAMTPYSECIFAANANCDLQVDAVDALLILRYVAALPVAQPPGCPKIGPP